MKARIQPAASRPTAGGLVAPEVRALAGIIRRRRERLQLSLNTLARRSGVSRPTISFIERDKRRLTVDTLERVSRALGFTGSELLAAAEQWLARLPAGCHACNFSCMARGELPWLNRNRECDRPPTGC